MSRVHDVLRWANRTAVAEEITRRGYRVSQETLNRWVRQDKEVPAIVERIVYELFTINGHEETPPPQWAEALPGEVAAAVIERLSEIPEIAQAAAIELGLAAPRPDESRTEADGAPRGTGHTALPPPRKRV